MHRLSDVVGKNVGAKLPDIVYCRGLSSSLLRHQGEEAEPATDPSQ
jgi:hypothetical protein